MANLAFVGKEYKWFVGQVPPNQLANKQEKGAWGNRVKIRIQGYHPAGPEVTNENLPWALIAKPTSQGSYNYGSTGLAGGEWVTGYFLDESCQIPVITHVLGTNQIENLTTLDEAKSAGTTYFKNVTRYNYGITAAAHQHKGGSKPKAPAQPTKEEVDKAVPENKDAPIEKPITESGQQKAVDEAKATEAKAIESEKISQSAPSTSSKYGSPDNPITNSTDLNTAISVKSDGSSIRTNVQPTIEQIDAAGKNGYRFAPFRDGRPGGSFKNSLLE
jgi:hypothetical protein